jgi:hypothetical protein
MVDWRARSRSIALRLLDGQMGAQEVQQRRERIGKVTHTPSSGWVGHSPAEKVESAGQSTENFHSDRYNE